MAAGWFGAVYLIAALTGLLAARGGHVPLGLPVDGLRGATVAVVGVGAVLAARGRRTLKQDLVLAVLGGFGALALIGLLHHA
jgi:hypothetical protein